MILTLQRTRLLKNFRASQLVVLFAFAALSAAALVSCGGTGSSSNSPGSPPSVAELSASDVQSIVQAAAAAVNAPYVIAVTNREGDILAVYQKPGFSPTTVGNFSRSVDTNELAVSLARTGAFFSNDQAPLSSRTVRFISGIHFPPGVTDTSNAPLYGIENTNRGCALSHKLSIAGESIPPARSDQRCANRASASPPAKRTSTIANPNAVNPGGVPIFKDGALLGGIGVAGATANVAEYRRLFRRHQQWIRARLLPPPGVVFINGVALPFVNQTTLPAGASAGTFSWRDVSRRPRRQPAGRSGRLSRRRRIPARSAVFQSQQTSIQSS